MRVDLKNLTFGLRKRTSRANPNSQSQSQFKAKGGPKSVKEKAAKEKKLNSLKQYLEPAVLFIGFRRAFR